MNGTEWLFSLPSLYPLLELMVGLQHVSCERFSIEGIGLVTVWQREEGHGHIVAFLVHNL